MFTIDLLKGECRPATSRPSQVALATTPFLPLLIAAAVMVSLYFSHGVALETTASQISSLDEKIAERGDAQRRVTQATADSDAAAKCRQDVALAVRSHIQWSDIMNEIAQVCPQNIVIYKFNVTRDKTPPKVSSTAPGADAQNGSLFRLSISGYASPDKAGNDAIQSLIDSINTSRVIGPRLSDGKVGMPSSRTGNYMNRNWTDFTLECILKSTQ